MSYKTREILKLDPLKLKPSWTTYYQLGVEFNKRLVPRCTFGQVGRNSNPRMSANFSENNFRGPTAPMLRSQSPASNRLESEGCLDGAVNHTDREKDKVLISGTSAFRERKAPTSPVRRTDLCYWEDLEIGEPFYLPLFDMLAGRAHIFFKTGIESYGIAPEEPEWDLAGLANDFWIVARAEVMQCRRCDCIQENPCWSFTEGACAWAMPGLCTACLNDRERVRILQELTEGTEAA